MEITFKIPALPPSMNQMYKINYHTRQCYLDEKAREFKRTASMYTPFISVSDQEKILVDVEYHGNWFTKAGKIRRKDGQNLDKALYDCICNSLGIDDSQAFEGSWKKIQGEEEFTIVHIMVKGSIQWMVSQLIEPFLLQMERNKFLQQLATTLEELTNTSCK
ncbi:RusA family crossover junction endodeoxyribonuclease [Candidatus Omnitrophota bacterium]